MLADSAGMSAPSTASLAASGASGGGAAALAEALLEDGEGESVADEPLVLCEARSVEGELVERDT